MWAECHFSDSLKYGFHCIDFYETCNGTLKLNFIQFGKKCGKCK